MPGNSINDKSTLVQVMFGAVRQQAITWAKVDQDLCHHIMSLGYNELISSKSKSSTDIGVICHYIISVCDIIGLLGYNNKVIDVLWYL